MTNIEKKRRQQACGTFKVGNVYWLNRNVWHEGRREDWVQVTLLKIEDDATCVRVLDEERGEYPTDPLWLRREKPTKVK